MQPENSWPAEWQDVAAVHWGAVRRTFVEQVARTPAMADCVARDQARARRTLQNLIQQRQAVEPALLLTWPPEADAHERLTRLRGDHGYACERYLALVQLRELLVRGQLNRPRVVEMVKQPLLWQPRPPCAATWDSLARMAMPNLQAGIGARPPLPDFHDFDWDDIDWDSLRT